MYISRNFIVFCQPRFLLSVQWEKYPHDATNMEMHILNLRWKKMDSPCIFYISRTYVIYLATHLFYVKCQAFIFMVELVKITDNSALNSSILLMKRDCGRL